MDTSNFDKVRRRSNGCSNSSYGSLRKSPTELLVPKRWCALLKFGPKHGSMTAWLGLPSGGQSGPTLHLNAGLGR